MAISVPHYEIAGWPREKHVINAFAAERRLRIAWADRYTFLDEIGVYPDNVYPYRTVMDATVTSVRFDPVPRARQAEGATADRATYDGELACRAILNYSTSGPRGANLITENLRTFRRYFRVNHNLLEWTGGTALTRDEAPFRSEVGLVYRLRYHNLTNIPANTILLPGYVNTSNTTAYFLGITFPPETLLYAGATVSHVISTAGTTNYDVEHVFYYLSNGGNGWNYGFRNSTGAYAQIDYKAGGQFRQHPLGVFNF